MLPDDLRQRTTQTLVERLRHIESIKRRALRSSAEVAATGIAPLDQLLPRGGFHYGTVTEWLAKRWGSGESTLALLSAAHIMQSPGELIVFDPRRQWYPPAFSSLGVDLKRTIFVRPPDKQKMLWAMEQALRCAAVRMVFCRIGTIEDRAYRRLQLAAEEGGALCFLFRPLKYYRQPSWADVRLGVEPHPSPLNLEPAAMCLLRTFQLQLLHVRGGFRSGTVHLQLDEQTGAIKTVKPLRTSWPNRRAKQA